MRDERGAESTMGHLVATMYRDSLADPARGGAEIGVVNSGGLRDDWTEAGELTIRDLIAVAPFANNLWTVDLTGKQLRSLLEEQWQPEGSSRNYLQLGLSENVRYTYNPHASRGERITGIWVNDSQVSDDRVVRVAVPNFLLQGGDNFTTLTQGTNAQDSGLVDSDVFQDWVKQHTPLAPDFRRQAAPLVESLEEHGIRFTLEAIDLTSLGSPKHSRGQLVFTPISDEKNGTVDTASGIRGGILPVIDGKISATARPQEQGLKPGEYRVHLEFSESGTLVTLAHTLVVPKSADQGGGVPGEGIDAQTSPVKGKSGAHQGATSGASSALAATGYDQAGQLGLAVLALLAGFAVLLASSRCAKKRSETV